nr:MAG TPA: ATP-dependent Clp protease ATP-binding subunit [Caudoviricetes sp.]
MKYNTLILYSLPSFLTFSLSKYVVGQFLFCSFCG